MKRFKKAYIEIGNICNLSCEFCPKTKRELQFMEIDKFKKVADGVLPFTDYIYLHIMGEPLLHPQLEDIIKYCNEIGLKVCITTNGTLIEDKKNILLNNDIHKISFSLHSFEGNEGACGMDEYIDNIIAYAKEKENQIVSLRLWNINGANKENKFIIDRLKKGFSLEKGLIEETLKTKRSVTLANKVFLQLAEKFDWPDMMASDMGDKGFCYGLRDQLGVLVDGSVVPCCLDHEGDIVLGNIFKDDLDNILETEKSRGIYEGFSKRIVVEELCRKCGYRNRFGK